MPIIIIILIILGVVYLFSSKFSPIPFYPTRGSDLPEIIKSLDLKNDQVLFDLGAGTGTVIFAAAAAAHAKGLNTKFIAIDINFVLVIIMWIRKLFHPNAQNITLIQGDLFTFDYKALTKGHKHISYYMYVSPWFTEPMAQLIIDTQQPSQIVSYYYPVGTLKEKKKIKGVHDIYLYEV